MQNSKIVQGSVVRLKIGGHKMTLFAEQPQKQAFRLAALSVVGD